MGQQIQELEIIRGKKSCFLKEDLIIICRVRRAILVNNFLEALGCRHLARPENNSLDPGPVFFLLLFGIDSFFFMNSLTLRMDTNSSVQETHYIFSSRLPWELK